MVEYRIVSASKVWFEVTVSIVIRRTKNFQGSNRRRKQWESFEEKIAAVRRRADERRYVQ